MKDQMIICPKCQCDGCYTTPINEAKYTYFCWGCGFQTNDLMKEKDFDFVAYEETLPELYKDLKYVDEDARVWYPIGLNVEGKGTVFMNGRNAQEAQWSAIPVILLTEDEKQQPKYKDLVYKSDAKALKYFGTDFLEACDYIKLFENQQ